jgi:hypothetical protein
MRIEAGDGDARLAAEPQEVIVAGFDGGQHPLGLGALDRALQRDMGGDVDGVQPLGGQQHEGALRACQMCEKTGVTVMVMAGKVHRFLVDRRGDDDIGLTRHGEIDGAGDIAHRGIASDGADLADFGEGRAERDFVDGDPVVTRCIGRPEPQRGAGDAVGALQRFDIADDDEIAALCSWKGCQGLDDHLGADTGRIAERHGDFRIPVHRSSPF